MDAEGGGGGGGGKQVKGNAIVKKPHGIITLRSLLPGGSKPEADSVRPSDRIIIEKLKTGNNKQQGPVNNKGGAPPPPPFPLHFTSFSKTGRKWFHREFN